jgi:hypothetical protein
VAAGGAPGAAAALFGHAVVSQCLPACLLLSVCRPLILCLCLLPPPLTHSLTRSSSLLLCVQGRTLRESAGHQLRMDTVWSHAARPHASLPQHVQRGCRGCVLLRFQHGE